MKPVTATKRGITEARKAEKRPTRRGGAESARGGVVLALITTESAGATIVAARPRFGFATFENKGRVRRKTANKTR